MGKIKKSQTFLYFIVSLVIASFPLLSSSVADSHDISFHLHRILGLSEALREGQFPALIQPDLNNGYGYAALAMYPSLFLYFPAMLHLLGLDLVYAYHIFLICLNAATFFCMYQSVRRITGDRSIAGLLAFVYVLSPYRLGCIYIRGALGEVQALCFLPLVLAGCYQILFGKKADWWILVLGATGMLQSHIISSFLTVLVCSLLMLVYIRRLWKEGRYQALLLSAGMLILCNLGFLIPFFDFYSLPLNVNEAGGGKGIYYLNAIIPAQLFNLFGDNFGISYTPEHGILGEMSMTLGFGVVLCVLIFLGYQWQQEKWKRGYGNTLFWAGGLLTLCSTTLLPWEQLQEVGWINRIAGLVQFPMRLLGIAAVCFLLAAAFAMAGWKTLPGKVRVTISIALVVVSIVTGLRIGEKAQQQPAFLQTGQELSTEGALGLGKEYLMQGTEEEQLVEDQYTLESGTAVVSDWEKEGTKIWFSYEAGEDSVVRLPLLWYPGYAARTDAGEVLTLFRGENNQVSLQLPSGSEGTVQVWYQGKGSYRAATVVSILAVCGVAFWPVLQNRRNRRDRS